MIPPERGVAGYSAVNARMWGHGWILLRRTMWAQRGATLNVARSYPALSEITPRLFVLHVDCLVDACGV
jgi:hypothetical protein